MPVVEGKAKAVATDEKAEPVAKQVAAPGESHNRFRSLRKYPKRLRRLRKSIRAYWDTLSKLAEGFYNSDVKWGKIYDANKDTCR